MSASDVVTELDENQHQQHQHQHHQQRKALPTADPVVGSDNWRRNVEGPYRRLDPNPDWLELARLAFCAVTIVPFRVTLIAIFLPAYYVLALCFLALAPNRPWAHSISIYAVRMSSWVLLRCMGFWSVDVKGLKENAGRRGEPRVFVSNHISYVEVLYFLAELGPSFVMKRTCLQVPFIGSIAAKVLDSVSVDNKGGKLGGSGSEAIAARLALMFENDSPTTADGGSEKGGNDRGDGAASVTTRRKESWRGNPLLIFPEGTTSNGSCILRFKTGVFAGVPVHPIVIRYNFERFSPAFESIYFPVHAFRMLAEPVNHLRVEYLPRYCPTPQQRADRSLYAKAVQKIFREATGLAAVESGYADKTRYHMYLRSHFEAHPWGAAAKLLPAPDRHSALLKIRSRKETELGSEVGHSGDVLPRKEVDGEEQTLPPCWEQGNSHDVSRRSGVMSIGGVRESELRVGLLRRRGGGATVEK